MGASIRGQPYSMVSRALGRGRPRSRGHLTAVPLFPAQPEPTGGLALGPRAGDRPTPGLGVGARPLLLNAQRTVTGHRTAQVTSALHTLPTILSLGTLRCDPNTQAADIDLRRT
ncbi:hypothetical protein EI555_013555, partial [Monodon monoceros]